MMTIPQILKPHFTQTDHCPLCDSNRFQKFLHIQGLNFCECAHCRFRFMNPHLSHEGMDLLYQNSEILSEVNPALGRYYEYEPGKAETVTQRDYLWALKEAQAIVKPSGQKPRLFEVGYGNGSFLREAAQQGWEVAGVDTSRKNSEMVRSKFGFNLDHGSFDDYTVKPDSLFDAVVFWDVIEHTMNPKRYVQKAFEMLQPGGVILLATPNIGGLLNLVSERLYFGSGKKLDFGVRQLYICEHVGYYNRKTLVKLVEDAGFVSKGQRLSSTDLERYEFSPMLQVCLKIFFFTAQILARQNRILLLAQKRSA